jgi:hypothetical protein
LAQWQDKNILMRCFNLNLKYPFQMMTQLFILNCFF